MEEYIGLDYVREPAWKCDRENRDTETAGGVRSYQVNHLDCMKLWCGTLFFIK